PTPSPHAENREVPMAFNLNKLTEKAQEAILAAQRLAEERHNIQVEPEHLLHALAAQDGGVVPAVLEKLGVQPGALLDQLEPSLGRLARALGPSQISISPRFRRV